MIKKAIFRGYFFNSIAVICEKYRLTFVFIFAIFSIIFLVGFGCSRRSTPSGNADIDEVQKHIGIVSTHISITAGEALYDFGYVMPNQKHEVDFVIQNPTKNDLQVQRVRSECKCMYALDPPKTIPAEGNAPLKMVFVSPQKPQYYDKKLIIQTTSHLYPLFVFRVKADVGRPLVCRPETIDAGTLEPNANREISVSIINRGASPVRPIYATSSMDGITAQIPRATIPPNGDLEIPLKIHLDGDTQEKGNAHVNIHTDLSNQPQVAVTIQYSLAKTSK